MMKRFILEKFVESEITQRMECCVDYDDIIFPNWSAGFGDISADNVQWVELVWFNGFFCALVGVWRIDKKRDYVIGEI